MTLWPWTRIAVLESQLLEKEERVEAINDSALYWKDKAEKLLDAALFKRGEITTPVFSKAEKASQSPFGNGIFGALNVNEIESAVKPATPVVPMK